MTFPGEPAVHTLPNVPPALRDLIRRRLVDSSEAWQPESGVAEEVRGQALADELVAAIEYAFDSREAPLLAHLRNLSYNLGQIKYGGPSEYFDAAERAVANVIGMLEQPR